jgi:hypothetical protein
VRSGVRATKRVFGVCVFFSSASSLVCVQQQHVCSRLCRLGSRGMHGTHGRRHFAGTYTACINASEPARACSIEHIQFCRTCPVICGAGSMPWCITTSYGSGPKKERVTAMLHSATWGSLLQCCHAPHHVGAGKLAAPVLSGAAVYTTSD